MPRNAEYDVAGKDIPRGVFPGGRIRFSLGVPPTSGRRQGEADRRRARMADLRRWGAWDVLAAVASGQLHVAEVARRVQQGGEQAVAEIRRELAAARMGAVPTFDEEARRYLEWYGRRRGEQSHERVQGQLRRLGEKIPRRDDPRPLAALPMDEITRADLEHAIEAITKRESTAESYRTALSGLFTWSVADEADRARAEKRAPRWTENPAAAIESAGRIVRVQTATDEQLLRLLAAAEVYQEAYLRSFLHLGLRRDELRHTRLHTDLDVQTWIWRIQPRGPDARCGCRQCQGRGWSPKTRRSVRKLLVPEKPARLRESIRRYLELYPCEPGDFVFRNPRTGRVWASQNLTADFARLCERAGVRYGRGAPGGLTFHVLRHTAATNLVRAGVRESVIADLLGDTVATIVEVYVHLTEEDLAEAIRRGPAYE